MRVLVVGGGLAGSSAAIALARRGFAVELVEPDAAGQGASISITNRGVDALEALGILDDVVARAVTIEGTQSIFTVIRDGAGKPLPVPPPPPRTDTRLPAAVILLRQQLAKIMRDAARDAGVALRHGIRLTALEQHADTNTVSARFDDGSASSHDLVVGADGLHSTVRELAFPAAPRPVYTGHMSFRWVLPDGPAGDTGFYMLPDSTTLATLRLREGQTYLATGIDMPLTRLTQDEARAIVRNVLDLFEAPFPRALRARLDDQQPIIVLPYSWLLMPPPWHSGRVVLIGDAVHTTTAHMASGGSLAVEDGVVLAAELATASSVEEGLECFVGRREPRTTRVVAASVELLRLQQSRAPPAASAVLRAGAVEALREPY